MASNATASNATQDLEELKKNIDDIFLVLNGIIVSLMQAGFALLEVGAVRTKNATNIMMKNLLDLFICALVYYLIGYSLSYGGGSPYIGLGLWAGAGLAESRLAHWFFQFVFAATAATVISGAVAERCNFFAYIVYNTIISGFVYPIVSHWVWYEDGWLANMGYKDFAGSGVVHALAGVCSLVGALLLGPRKGRFINGKPAAMPGHSTPMAGVGALLLISGFLAFNGGSLGHASQAGDGSIIAKCIVNTIMAGSGAGVICMLSSRLGIIGEVHWPFTITLNAILTGMVAVCAGADIYSFLGAAATGALSFPFYISLHHLILLIRVDDPLDAVAVHFGGGFWGVISAPIFGNKGIVYGGSQESFLQLGYNIVGLIVIIVWSALCSLIVFGLLRLSGHLRVTEEEECIGMDLSKHGEDSYPSSAWHWKYLESQKGPLETYLPRNNEYDNNAFEMDKPHTVRTRN